MVKSSRLRLALGKRLNIESSTFPKESSPSIYSDPILLTMPVSADEVRNNSSATRMIIQMHAIHARHLTVFLIMFLFIAVSI